MSTKSEELARKQKAARSKKTLLLLVPVLIALVAFQGPRLMKRLGDAKEATEEKQGEVVQGFEELAPNGVPATTAPGVVPADPAAALAAAESIADTDTPPLGGESDLVSFTRFEARDPFVQLVDDAGAEEPARRIVPERGDLHERLHVLDVEHGDGELVEQRLLRAHDRHRRRNVIR